MSTDNMSTESYHGSEPADRLDAVLADYLQAIEEGRPPNRQLLLERHPDVAEELREFFADSDLMRSHANRVRFIVPRFVGDYQVLEEIGSGAFGVVVKALDVKLEKSVAIKLLRGEQWSSPEYVRRFKAEARKQAKLDHPHIVPVSKIGEHEGQHYFVMKLIDGGNLTQRLWGYTAEERRTSRYQRWAAQLMAKIAGAVHYAHQHAIIHRDLKPGNILLDAKGEPHITDFGLAIQVEEGDDLFDLGDAAPRPGERFGWEHRPEADTVTTEKGLIVGTLPYMSPEQADGAELSTATDVWSLGVVLYEVLSGQVPLRGATPKDTMRLIRQEAPPPLRSRNSGIDARLEKICVKCLQQKPEDRYGSALDLARNLQRWLENQPITHPPDAFSVRCRLWCRRNPALASLLVTAAALFLFVASMVLSVSRARAQRLEKEVVESNVYAAQGVADRMLVRFRDWANAVYEVSEDPELRRLVKKAEVDGLKETDEAGLIGFLKRTHEDSRRPRFDAWVVLQRGRFLVGSPWGKDQGDFSFRDYFIGANELLKAGQRGVNSVYVSRAYRSSHDKQYRIGISRALHKDCVLVAAIKTDPTMDVPGIHDERRKAVLIGPEDPKPRPGVRRLASDNEYLILLHEGYKHGVDPVPISKETIGFPLQSAGAKQLSLPDAASGGPREGMANYLDPVAERNPDYGGRWLAGFAPVGYTGYTVIVQQRYDEAVPSDDPIIWGGAAVLVGALFVMLIAWFAIQRLTRTRD